MQPAFECTNEGHIQLFVEDVQFYSYALEGKTDKPSVAERGVSVFFSFTLVFPQTRGAISSLVPAMRLSHAQTPTHAHRQ